VLCFVCWWFIVDLIVVLFVVCEGVFCMVMEVVLLCLVVVGLVDEVVDELVSFIGY